MDPLDIEQFKALPESTQGRVACIMQHFSELKQLYVQDDGELTLIVIQPGHPNNDLILSESNGDDLQAFMDRRYHAMNNGQEKAREMLSRRSTDGGDEST